MTQPTTSSIPRVLDALEDTFSEALANAHLDSGPVSVTQGTDPNAPRVYVEVGDVVADAQQEWAPFGARGREELYAVGMHISVGHHKFKTQREAKDYAFGLLALCETALRADPTLGLMTAGEDPFKGIRLEVGTIGSGGDPTDQGYLYEIEWAVRVWARI